MVWHDPTRGSNDPRTRRAFDSLASRLRDLPWGVMGYASRTSAQNGNGVAYADVTSLTVSFTADSTRVYETTVHIPQAVQQTVLGSPSVIIADGSNNQLAHQIVTVPTAGYSAFFHLTLVETGLSGSVTRKVRIKTTNNTVDLTMGSTAPGIIVVKDIGPA